MAKHKDVEPAPDLPDPGAGDSPPEPERSGDGHPHFSSTMSMAPTADKTASEQAAYELAVEKIGACRQAGEDLAKIKGDLASVSEKEKPRDRDLDFAIQRINGAVEALDRCVVVTTPKLPKPSPEG